jgi:beta-lactam-binding protein with PASTA domain
MPVRRRAPDQGEATQVIDEPAADPRLQATDPTASGAPIEEPPPDRNLWPWLVVLLVLIVAALVGAELAARKNGTGSASPTSVPPRTIVPGVVGLPAPAAVATLQAQGLQANVVSVPSSAPANRVVAQHPRAGGAVPPGSTVRLNASTGPTTTRTAVNRPPPSAATPELTVPDVRGEKVNDARKELRSAGLDVEFSRVPSDLPKNTVVSQSPAPGTATRLGEQILVTASSGGHKEHSGHHRGADGGGEDQQ